MRLRTCNNRRRAQAHYATTRASLKRVWARVAQSMAPKLNRMLFAGEDRPWTMLAFSRPEDLRDHRLDALVYGIAAMKDGKRIAPEDLYVEPPRTQEQV